MDPGPDASSAGEGPEPVEPLVLAVEDDEQVGRVIRRALEFHGLRFVGESDGARAVDRVLSVDPDLVLLDLALPNRSGSAILADLRASQRTAHIPVLLLTAQRAVSEEVGDPLAGADDYIVKPFAAVELVARIRAALRRAREPRPPTC